MSRTQSVEALDFRDRLERTEGVAAKIAQLEAKLAQIEARNAELEAERAATKPPETFGDRLRAMNRRTDEYLAKCKEDAEKTRAADEVAQKERRDAEARRLAAEPKSPSLDQIRRLQKTVETLLAYAGVEKYTYLQEEALLPYVEKMIDALLELEAAPTTGWPLTARKGISGLVREVRSILGRWGWYHLVVAPEPRRTVLDNLRKEWQFRTEIPVLRVAELWLQLAEEGTEPWPSEKVVRMGLTARERNYHRLEILPRHRAPVMGEKDIQDKISVPQLFDERWNARGNIPMFGNSRPAFTDEQRTNIKCAISVMCESLPQEQRPWGWLVGGSTVAT